MKKAGKIFAALLVLVLIGMIWIPIPFRLKKTLLAVEVRHGDPNHAVQREIQIDGTYSFYLYKEDEFRGNLEIEGHEGTVGHEVISLLVTTANAAPLVYLTDDFFLNSLGSIFSTWRMNKLFIAVNENNSWSGAEGISIVAPATTREEAKVIWQQLSRNNDWLAAVSWE